MVGEELIEAVARSINRTEFPYNDQEKDIDGVYLWRRHELHAQAAITAHLKHLEDKGLVIVPREPTEVMKATEGVHWGWSCHTCGGAKEHWNLLIAAAQEEEPNNG